MTRPQQPYTIYFEKYKLEDFAHYNRLLSDEEVMAMITERALPEEEARKQFDELLHNNTYILIMAILKYLKPERKLILDWLNLKYNPAY